MMTIKNCCCCSVRTACIIFGILGVLGGIIIVCSVMTHGLTMTQEDLSKIGIPKEYYDLYKAFSVIDFISTIANFLVYFCLLFGTLKEKDKFLLPAIYYIPIDTLFRLIKLLALSASIGFTLAMNIIGIGIMAIILDFCVWLCVYSHRRELLDGGKTQLA